MKHSRNLCIGPGGRKCNCCFPAPGSKARRLEYRKAKKADQRAAIKAEELGYNQLVERGPVNFDKFEG
jgi:hypothetical protein